MATRARRRLAMERAGFADFTVTDRKPWYREVARGEPARFKGPLYAVAAVGKNHVDKNVRIWEASTRSLTVASTAPLICVDESRTRKDSRPCGDRQQR